MRGEFSSPFFRLQIRSNLPGLILRSSNLRGVRFDFLIEVGRESVSFQILKKMKKFFIFFKIIFIMMVVLLLVESRDNSCNSYYFEHSG